MVHCSRCGVLEDVGESVICEDCADKMEARPLSEAHIWMTPEEEEKLIRKDERERCIKLTMDRTSGWYHLTFETLERYRKGLEESLRSEP